MNDLLKQISSYNLFNYLLPGAVFSVLAEFATGAHVKVDSIFAAFFFYYFLGLIVSRIGSLLIEPILRKTGLIKFADYSEFVRASNIDPKIEQLSESNNVFRTMCSVGICLVVFIFGYKGAEALNIDETTRYVLLGTGLFLLFVASYRKQTSYVTKRITLANSTYDKTKGAAE